MNQPTIKDQEELLSIDSGEKTEVIIPETKYKMRIGWMKPYTLERVSRLILKEEEHISDYDPKVISQLTSLYVLNGMRIFFFHGIYWRYLYYIKGYRYDQLLPVIEIAKKKVPAKAYIKAIILASGMKITPMSLTTEEAESIRAGLLSE